MLYKNLNQKTSDIYNEIQEKMVNARINPDEIIELKTAFLQIISNPWYKKITKKTGEYLTNEV